MKKALATPTDIIFTKLSFDLQPTAFIPTAISLPQEASTTQ